MANCPGSFDIFLTFFRISAVSLGGGYAMVPVLERFMEKRRWMEQDDFCQMLCRAQAIPGPIALNLSLLVGRRLGGMRGAVMGALGVMLPPFFTIILVGSLLARFSNSSILRGALRGAFGAVIGLLGGVVLRIFRTGRWKVFHLTITAIAVTALFLCSSGAMPIIAIAAVTVYIGERRWTS